MTIQAQVWSKDVALTILNLDARTGCVLNGKRQTLYAPEEEPVPIVQGVRWTPPDGFEKINILPHTGVREDKHFTPHRGSRR